VAEHLGGTEEAFVESMNAKAAQLGLRSTHFANPHGLPDPAGRSTALDMARLIGHVVQDYPASRPLLGGASFIYRGRVHSRRIPLFQDPGGVQALKTGFTRAAGYNLAIAAWRAGQRDFLLVLFLVLAAWGAARAWESGGAHVPLLWGGLAAGTGVMIKPQAALFWIACATMAESASPERRSLLGALASIAPGMSGTRSCGTKRSRIVPWKLLQRATEDSRVCGKPGTSHLGYGITRRVTLDEEFRCARVGVEHDQLVNPPAAIGGKRNRPGDRAVIIHPRSERPARSGLAAVTRQVIRWPALYVDPEAARPQSCARERNAAGGQHVEFHPVKVLA